VFTNTFSSKLPYHVESGILENITAVQPEGNEWVLVNSSFIPETLQICWTWKRNNPDKIVTVKPDSNLYSRIYAFSVNTCDPTTWYVESQYASGVELFPSLSNLLPISLPTGESTYNYWILPQNSGVGNSIIDLSHGKVTEENLLVAPTGTYQIEVFIDGVKKTERECYENVGGDYQVDYENGYIFFFNAISGMANITANYYYSPSGVGPIFSVTPPVGKKWIIDTAELQVSTDFEMTDTIVQNVFLTHPVYGRIKAIEDVEYKRIDNFLDFTFGSHPIIPAFGGALRGSQQDTIIMRWQYLTPLELLSSLQMELRSWSKHGRKLGGERFVVTVYGLETDE